MNKRICLTALVLAFVLVATGCAFNHQSLQPQSTAYASEMTTTPFPPEAVYSPTLSTGAISDERPQPLENESPEEGGTISSPLPEDNFVSVRELEVDLSNAETYYGLNLFLSNFSECGLERLNNDATQENMETAVKFAFYHRWWNGGGGGPDGPAGGQARKVET